MADWQFVITIMLSAKYLLNHSVFFYLSFVIRYASWYLLITVCTKESRAKTKQNNPPQIKIPSGILNSKPPPLHFFPLDITSNSDRCKCHKKKLFFLVGRAQLIVNINASLKDYYFKCKWFNVLKFLKMCA